MSEYGQQQTSSESAWVVFLALVSNTFGWFAVDNHIVIVNHIIGCIAGIIAIVIGIRKLMKDKR